MIPVDDFQGNLRQPGSAGGRFISLAFFGGKVMGMFHKKDG